MQIGALWLKEKDGKKYFSGQIEYPGVKLNFAIFKNEKKENPNQPDYQIVWNPPKEGAGNGGGAPAASSGNPFDEGGDIPF